MKHNWYSYDHWITNDYYFDEFHGQLPKKPEKPDWMTEREMEKLREKYKIGENNEQ